jgi:hypothetical protein
MSFVKNKVSHMDTLGVSGVDWEVLGWRGFDGNIWFCIVLEMGRDRDERM